MEDKAHHCLVAVHAGAGYHSKDKESLYTKLCVKACKKAMILLKEGRQAVDAVATAIAVLENSPHTNAGIGSSLTLSGSVECDASIMDGCSLMYGTAGAVQGVKNPILVAKKLLEEQTHSKALLGRIPPCVLVGDGARRWSESHGIPTVPPDQLKTDTTIKTYVNHKRRLELAEERRQKKRRFNLQDKVAANPGNSLITKNESRCTSHKAANGRSCDVSHVTHAAVSHVTDVQDTVGAVCIDCRGHVAAAVSSGGISLKQPGRLGPAAVYGAGCWASNQNHERPAVAVATSGCGEHVMKTLLARECAHCLQSDEWAEHGLRDTLKNKFLESDVLQCYGEKFAGVLALRVSGGEQEARCAELLFGHTTDSMCVGYMSSSSKAKAQISRLGDQQVAGHTYVIQGQSLQL